MSGKGMGPQKGYDQKKYDSGYDDIDWGRGKAAKREQKNTVSSKEAKKMHCRERKYHHGLS